MSRSLLAVYLSDHAAIAAGGVELARRAGAGNGGTRFGTYAHALAAELAEHDAALRVAMQAHGIHPSRLKNASAWIGEKAGRLKLNGRLVSKSPLSPVTEAEGLMAVLGAHLLVWEALADLPRDVPPPGVDAALFAASARRHLGELAQHRRELLREAFDATK